MCITSIPNIIRISSLTVLYSELGKGYYGIRPDLVRAQIEIESETYQSANYIVGPSSYMLSKLLTYGSQHKYRLPTPIEINNNSKPLGKSILSNRVGFFGSVDYRKGVDLLIDAISNVQILELELFICGRLNDDSDENSTIKSRVISEKFIHYSDSLPKQQLFELMGDMDVIILPSRVDNFPNTLLESMAMGKIVIGPNAWGFEEVIEHGVNGLLFECGNLNSLVRVIENFFSMSQKERILMEEKAFHSAQNYAGSKVFNEILDVYQQCIDHHDSLCAESLD